MRIPRRVCSAARVAYTAPAGALSTREWADLEAHTAMCAECAQALRDGVALDVALDRAFAPLRARRTPLAPGRVRLALGPRRAADRAPMWLRMPRMMARLAEVSVAVGITIFAVSGSLDQVQTTATGSPSVIHEYFRSRPPADDLDYFRWLRLQPAPIVEETRQAVRFPVGGRFDVDQVEIVTNPTSTPR